MRAQGCHFWTGCPPSGTLSFPHSHRAETFPWSREIALWGSALLPCQHSTDWKWLFQRDGLKAAQSSGGDKEGYEGLRDTGKRFKAWSPFAPFQIWPIHPNSLSLSNVVLRNSCLVLYKYEFTCTIEGFCFPDLKVNFLNLAFIALIMLPCTVLRDFCSLSRLSPSTNLCSRYEYLHLQIGNWGSRREVTCSKPHTSISQAGWLIFKT